MPHIPAAFCAPCGKAMKIKQTGVVLEVFTEARPYYKISADSWYCPSCEATIFTGFGGCVYPHEEIYKNLHTETEVRI